MLALAPTRARAQATSSVLSLASLLVPALHNLVVPCHFSTSASRQSKLGRTPISIPPGVELTIGEPFTVRDLTHYKQIQRKTLTVAGPLGTLDLNIAPYLRLDHDPIARRLVLSVEDKKKRQQVEMWGTTWAYIQRHIIGVSEGHTAVLRLVGIGFRASIDKRPKLEAYPDQDFVCLRLGFSHPIDLGVPNGVKASTPQPTRILLEGVNREELMQFAANIRKWRKPEPYKGKGIFVNNETIKLKQKKIK